MVIMSLFSSLLLVIFLEGYVVLSTELLAIRLLTPFTGSGSDTVSIIIAAVLLPLAFGYAAGGKFKVASDGSVRKKLVRNLAISACFLTVGLSYIFLGMFFVLLQKIFGLNNRLILTSLYSALFLIIPVYLLGQTVPLVSHYFSREKISKAAGKMLFFSTLGSFMGAVFCTLVLMTYLGVHHAVSITMACLTVLCFLLTKNYRSWPVLVTTGCLLITLNVNSASVMKGMHIVSNNKYNTAQIEERPADGMRILKLNNTNASAVYTDITFKDDHVFDYVRFIDDNFLRPIRETSEPKSILVLGAGGFTLGRTDMRNTYTYVDIDAELKKVVEEKFLEEPLGDNKKFVPMDARAFLIQSNETYDVIIIDLFRDPVSAPENLMTQEFFEEVKKRLTPSGMMAVNIFASPAFSDAYSRNLDTTLRAVFPALNRQAVLPFNAWAKENDLSNIIYSYFNHPDAKYQTYTDNKNSSALDRPANLRH